MEELWEFFAGEEARRYRRTFSRVGAAMLAMILLPVGAQLLLQGLALAWAPALLEDTVFLYAVSALSTYGIGFPAAMLVLLTLRPEGRDPERRRLNAQTWLGLWLLAIGWLYIANMVTLSLMDVLTTLRGEAIPNPVEALGELPVAFNLIYSCLLAPVCEELCFRWMILRRLRPWGDGFAVCASALLFALVHGNLYQMLYAFADEVQQLRDYGARDIILDPGFGFGKDIRQNYALLSQMDRLQVLGLPLLVGVSRKRMAYQLVGGDASTALNATTAIHAVALMKGANLLRVHDVKEAMEAVRVVSETIINQPKP